MKTDVLIIGAGAAGLQAAIFAGRRGRRVRVLDHARRIGEKIRISGGGRCNFTNLHARPENFISANPHFCRSALARYTPQDFIERVNRHGIRWTEKKLGQLFVADETGSQAIIDMLLGECEDAGADIQAETRIDRVRQADGGFVVATDRGEYFAESLVVATGGLSIPKIGATGFAHDLARQFGLPVTALKPGLVPYTLPPEELGRLTDLAGVSLDVAADAGGARFRENVLVTHRGLSGPAALQTSSYWTPGDSVTLDLLPDLDVAEALQAARRGGATAAGFLAQHLPKRFAQAFAENYLPPGRIADWTAAAMQKAAERLSAWTLRPSGTEGYKKAEVTVGGIDTAALSSKTMEAKAVPGLFVVGEAMDVTGHLGGFNFTWAWASGYAAGMHA